jgi:hypothetical protein
MEMQARCDTEARRKYEKELVLDAAGSIFVKVESHYSFTDQRCYAQVATASQIGSQPIQTVWELNDGLTGKNLLTITLNSGEKVSGPLASGRPTRKEAFDLLKVYMTKE